MKNNKKYEIDMTNGTIMDKLITFSLPLMLSGILQLMFNAVDIIVVGQFSGSPAVSSSRLNECADKCVYQFFYRHFAWNQCAGCTFFCFWQDKGNV